MRNKQQPTATKLDIERAVGARVRELRRARGISQSQLGQALAGLGYPMEQPTIYKLENGTRPLRLNEVAALAAVFEVNLTDLLAAELGEEDRRAALHEILDLDQRIGSARNALTEAEVELDELKQQLRAKDAVVSTLHADIASLLRLRSGAGERFNELQGKAQTHGKR